MNPRFQRIFNIATINIELRMAKMQDKWSQNGNVQSKEIGQPAQDSTNVQRPAEPISQPEQGGDINGTGNQSTNPASPVPSSGPA